MRSVEKERMSPDSAVTPQKAEKLMSLQADSSLYRVLPSVDTIMYLPPAPKGKTGWPWEPPNSPAPSYEDMPLISIVTPSFNQGQFLEETIRSVLLQGYPKLEYMVIDGGSRDESVDIIKKYAPWLSYWVSEPDRGQPHAINKGLERSRGSLFGFINSDDLLLPRALQAAGTAHMKFPSSLVAGDVFNFREGEIVCRVRQCGLTFETFVRMWRHPEWHQPGVFIPRGLIEYIGPFDESQQYGFDYEFMCRALSRTDVHFLSDPVAMFRLQPDSKTCANDILIMREQLKASKRFWHQFDWADRATYRRYAAEHLFCEGCSRLGRGSKHALGLMIEGLRAQPARAIASAASRWPSWVARRLRH
jgi:glycosyltransferase involved in cell wall biosynthesis